jgi:uncharacterized protein
MGNTATSEGWQPVLQAERYVSLDALRGLALLGVLLVNLLSDFRVSLSEHILSFHTHAGRADRAVDVLVAALIEFKAFGLFSLLFGVGLAIFAERAAARHAGAGFLVRRLVVLLALGLIHLLLVWNGDILTLYAICGFLLIPFLRLPAGAQAALGVSAIALPYVVPLGIPGPTEETLRGLAAEAARTYTEGNLGEVIAFHWRETRLLVVPLLAGCLPRTFGLMALGAAGWRAGVFREPERHRGLLWGITLVFGVVGASMTALAVYSSSTGQEIEELSLLIEAGSSTPLALAYAAGLLLALRSPKIARTAAPFAAAGQMALTNYFTQSVALSLLFYGYSLGLFGQVGPAAGAAIGVALYVGQVAFSVMWLGRWRFGPVEWLWRSLTYGKRQPMGRRGALD